MIKSIGKALNMSLDIADVGEVLLFVADRDGKQAEKLKVQPFILVGSYAGVDCELDYFGQYTRSYFSIRFAWYTPCAVKCRRCSCFFSIFSVDMWVCFTLSMVLAVITVSSISVYQH
jgi:hypothetical protein